MAVRTVIVDDETLARRRLRDMLETVSWVECIGEAADGKSAVRMINELAPDLVLMDVQMPELSGLQVLARVQHDVEVIFTTAYDQYAVAAFELQALDYLVKPFGRDRLVSALERVRAGLRDRSEGPTGLERAESVPSAADPLTRIFVRDRSRIVPIATRDIERLEGEGDYVGVHAGGERYLVYLSLKEFERRLNPERFLRIHRSHIVNLDFVSHLSPSGDGRLQVHMRDGTELVASRARSKDLRRISL